MHHKVDAGEPWNGLRVELQYRTIHQHAWATAVEVAGLLTGNELKFGRATDAYERFFICASEIIARTHEGLAGPIPWRDLTEVAEELRAIDDYIGITNIFDQYNRVANQIVPMFGNAIIIFHKRQSESEKTEVRSYRSFAEAVRELGSLERANITEDEPYDMVLVRSDNAAAIRNAFRNYFTDTRDFMTYLRDGLSSI